MTTTLHQSLLSPTIGRSDFSKHPDHSAGVRPPPDRPRVYATPTTNSESQDGGLVGRCFRQEREPTTALVNGYWVLNHREPREARGQPRGDERADADSLGGVAPGKLAGERVGRSSARLEPLA